MREVKGDSHEAFLFYLIINYQFKTSELKNVEKLVEQTLYSSLKALLEWTGKVQFCTICKIIFVVQGVGGPWKSNVFLEISP